MIHLLKRNAKKRITHHCTGVLLLIFIFSAPSVFSQGISSKSVIPVDELEMYLKKNIRENLQSGGAISKARLADYFRDVYGERFFYNWETAEERFETYNHLYQNKKLHYQRAQDHLSKYEGSTLWKLPFAYKNGEPVDAYALRHLARQHKMLDIAYYYFYQNKDPKYIHYFTQQMQSLNKAFHSGEFEKINDGNGVYEVFRSGYRILNWISIHNLFLGQKEYGDQDQLYTIATLLHHGAHLYENNSEFRSGNHQTRGMSALAMLSILFKDFVDTDLWFDRAMQRLGEHLSKEINSDGFQFERSVHYHISDISNYFYVYQLAKINSIEVDEEWENKLLNLFETLVKIAYPDKTAPVLQDDTDNPWAEKNEVSRTMSLGYLLFEKPEFGYFADKKVEDRLYWFLNKNQLKKLENIDYQKPEVGSYAFPQTGYYIMREGWDANDKMMIISAGLDDKKPDHQHGDMLGIQAMANGQTILPNYQVRYSLEDYDWFKNSMVKNVALVDDQLQGKKWTSNKGKSGFGKFKELPLPEVKAWISNPVFDFFAGSHDGFRSAMTQYTRQVIFVKDEFWIIKDNFQSDSLHSYKQVWQGHYTLESGPNILRSTFPDGSGCDIFSFHDVDGVVQDGKRGKQWSVLYKERQSDFNFLTIVYPYTKYNDRIDENESKPKIGGWSSENLPFSVNDGKFIMKGEEAYIFEVSEIEMSDVHIVSEQAADLYISWKSGDRQIHSLNPVEFTISIIDKNPKSKKVVKTIAPGEIIKF